MIPTAPATIRIFCELCPAETFSLDEADRHATTCHPDYDSRVQRWPDGGVVVDATPALEGTDRDS